MASNDLVANDLIDSLDKESDFSVKVSIEPNHECEIYEIKYNGQEIYKEYYYKEKFKLEKFLISLYSTHFN
jgi:hypothetical protein